MRKRGFGAANTYKEVSIVNKLFDGLHLSCLINDEVQLEQNAPEAYLN